MPKDFQKIKVNGKEIPKGYVLNKWFASRYDANKNVLLIFVGATGSGKSWSCIRCCEDWYKFRFNKPFPQENICFSLNEAGKRIRDGKLERGEFIIIEEAGVIANALEFQNKIVKFFHFFLQSSRCKNIGIIFNLPNLNLLTKTTRSLAHGIFQTTRIDKQKKAVICKPFYLQTNPLTGKIYQKYLRQRIDGHVIKIERIEIDKPSEEVIKMYEGRKNIFVDKTLTDLIEVSEEKKPEKPKENVLWKAIKNLYESGVENQFEMSKVIGISQPRISRNLQLMIENGYFVPKYLEKAEKYASKLNLTPIST